MTLTHNPSSLVEQNGRADLQHRLKFALWDFSRRHPAPGAAIRAVGKVLMGGADKARRNHYAAALPAVLPDDEYRRDRDVPTQAWLLSPPGHDLDRAGAAMLLNHLRIPYRTGDLGTAMVHAAVVFVAGYAWADVVQMRNRLNPSTLIVCFHDDSARVQGADGIQVWGLARRLLPHLDGLRSDFAAAVIRGLRDGLQVPLVTGKFAPLVGLRIDDVEGHGLETWLPAMLAHGWRPNLGLFINGFAAGDNPATPSLAAHCRDQRCDVSPHAFDAATFLFFDYPWGRPYSRNAFSERWRQAQSCLARNNLPLSPVLNTHFHVLSRTAADMLAPEGIEYFFSELALDGMNPQPDRGNWPSGDATLCTGRTDASGIYQLSSGDYILDVMQPRSNYDFMMHGGEEGPDKARARIKRRLTLSLDCGFPAYITTHEYFFGAWPDAASHDGLWASVDDDLSGTGWGNVRKVPLKDIARSAKTARCSKIVAVSTEANALKVTISGAGGDHLTILGCGRAITVPAATGLGRQTLEIPLHCLKESSVG